MGSIRDKALDDYDDGKRLKSNAEEWLDSGSENVYEAEEIIKAQTATIDKLVEALGASNVCLHDWAVKGGAKNTFDLLSSNSKLIHELDLINSVTEKK